MVISILANGDIKNIIPENIYQGSNKANTIYVVAPFASNIKALISFEVATTGQIIPATLMDSPTSISNELNMWKVNVSQALTQYYGEVKYQVKFLNAEDVVVATARGKFRVQEGVDFDLPESPDEATYTLILQKLSDIEAHFLNGWIEAQALKIYNTEFSYSLNSFVLGQVNGKVSLYKSLIENNQNNELTNTEAWELIELGADVDAILRSAKEYTDEEISKLVNGDTIVKKAEQDSEGNNIASHYSTQKQWLENVDNIDKNIDAINKIKSGTTTVNKALNDKNGNDIAETYLEKSKVVTGWSSTPSHENVPSEKLVKDALNDIASGGTINDIVFDTYAQFVSWLDGTYTREDGFTTEDLKIGTGVLLKEENTSDYWCSSIEKPITINNFTPFEVAINLSDYLAKDNTDEFIPTGDYNPATKKYVDDKTANAGLEDIEFLNHDGNGYIIISAYPQQDTTIQFDLSRFKFSRTPAVDDIIDIPTYDFSTGSVYDYSRIYDCKWKITQINSDTNTITMSIVNVPVPHLIGNTIVTSITASSTDKFVPSAKAVYDMVAPLDEAIDNENTAILNIIKGQYLSEGYNVQLSKSESGVTITSNREFVEFDVPSTATQGILEAEDVAMLQANSDAYILFNGEIYTLNGKEHTAGYLTYSNVEYESNETRIKTITITLSTLSWVLTENVVASKNYVDGLVGDIDTLLIDINSGSGV